MAIDLTIPLQNTVSAISPRTVSSSLETDVKKVAPAGQEKTTSVREIPDSITTPPNALSKDDLYSTVPKLNEYVDQQKRGIRFSIDEGANRTVIKLLDSKGDVLKQFPSEDALAILEGIERNKELFFESNA